MSIAESYFFPFPPSNNCAKETYFVCVHVYICGGTLQEMCLKQSIKVTKNRLNKDSV